jgi:AraC-like DNA-binding protein
LRRDPSRLLLDVRAAGRTVVGRDWAWNGVRSRFLRLYTVHAGAGTVRVGGRRLDLRRGRTVLVPAGGPLDFACPDRLDHTWVHVQVVGPDGDATGWFAADDADGPDLAVALARVPGLLRGGPADRFAADGLLRVVLARFLTAEVPAEDALERTAAWARQRLAEPLRLADLAAAAGLGERDLRQRWRERWGLAPTGWLRRERLATARALARREDLTMDAIAVRVGLGGRCQLSRWLRRSGGR